MFKVNNEDTRMTPGVVMVSLLLSLNIFRTLFKCYNRFLNNEINRWHQRCLHILYSDKIPTIQELVKRDGSASIHHQSIRFLAIEMLKVFVGISPQIVKEIFQFTANWFTNKESRQIFKSHLYIVLSAAQML